MMATKFKKSKINKSSSTDDAQRLILQSSLSLTTAGRRPRFLVRSKNKLTNKLRKSWNRGKKNHIKSEPTKKTKEVTLQPAQQNPETEKQKRKRKIPKVIKKAGQKMKWLMRKSGHYLGVAIIKIFNQPSLYTEDSRTCVV